MMSERNLVSSLYLALCYWVNSERKYGLENSKSLPTKKPRYVQNAWYLQLLPSQHTVRYIV